eukprot:4336554-Pyramimonas_sp.AAC.1
MQSALGLAVPIVSLHEEKTGAVSQSVPLSRGATLQDMRSALGLAVPIVSLHEEKTGLESKGSTRTL